MQAIIQRPTWSTTVKWILAVVRPIVLALIVLASYYVYTGDMIPDWPVLVLLAIVVAQASYALLAKPSAAVLERKINLGSSLRRDFR